MACFRLSEEYRDANHVRKLHIVLDATLDYSTGLADSKSRIKRSVETFPVTARHVTLRVNTTDHLSGIWDPIGRLAGALDHARQLHTFQVLLYDT